jgi:endonuclease-3
MDKKKAQVAEILARLKKEYTGKPSTVLHFSTPFELLVATIMSAQTTDVLVNRVTEVLFKKYKSPEDFAGSSPEQIAQDIKPVNFYNTKAKNIHSMAKLLIEKFDGNVPKTMEQLITLPGVARKTANIVLSSAFGINEGIAVDTHVMRLSIRLGLTKQKDPVRIEQDLIAMTPRPQWNDLAYLLIFHGRAVCQAKKPKHGDCVLFDICPSRNI